MERRPSPTESRYRLRQPLGQWERSDNSRSDSVTRRQVITPALIAAISARGAAGTDAQCAAPPPPCLNFLMNRASTGPHSAMTPSSQKQSKNA